MFALGSLMLPRALIGAGCLCAVKGQTAQTRAAEDELQTQGVVIMCVFVRAGGRDY